MGNSIQNKKTTIENYENIKLPFGHRIVKLVSYDINIQNSINLEENIKGIIRYMFGSFKNKEIDICALQGINDNYSVYELIKEVNNYCLKNEETIYICPEFENINPNKQIITSSSKNMLCVSKSGGNCKKETKDNIIFSRFPIINYTCTKLKTYANNNIFGTNSALCCNLDIDGNVISVYNSSFSYDLENINVFNTKRREKELKLLLNIVKKNTKDLKNNETFKSFEKSNIHMITGSLKFKEFKDQYVTPEYNNLFTKYKLVDIYRFLNKKNTGYTTITNKRNCYMLLALNDDIFDPKLNNKKLFKKILKKSGIYFLDTYVYNKNTNNHNYPVEIIFILKT